MTSYAVSGSKNLTDQALENELRDAGVYVAAHLRKYINWKGTTNLEIRIADRLEFPHPNADGILSAFGILN